MNFAETAHDYARAEAVFTAGLLEADPASPIDWGRMTTDEYDNSIELCEVPNDNRLSETQQLYINDAGFYRCWLNHCDGWETYYAHFFRDGKFSPSEGHRRERNSAPAPAVVLGKPPRMQ